MNRSRPPPPPPPPRSMKTEKGQGEEGQEGGEQDGGIEGAVEQTGIDMEDCLTSGGEHGLREPLAPEHDVE